MASASRSLRFELHVRPLMRLIDRDNMLPVGIDLLDYEQVRSRSADILARLRQDMPPLRYGGPWPEEWIALFERWVDTGFPRLDLGRASAAGYRATQAGLTVTLSGVSTPPGPGCQAWLDAALREGEPREFVHYLEPPDIAPPGNPTPLRLRAAYESAGPLAQIVVTDADGRHVVPVVPA